MSGGFPGGLRLAGHDPRLTAKPPEAAPLSAVLTLPLAQHAGLPAEPVVAVGDRVLRGSLLATPSDTLSAAVHAPTSGTVRLIASRPVPHPSGLSAPCIVIDADGRDDAAPALPALDWERATPAALIARVREAGIVGLGGAVFPTHVKLQAPRAPDLLILNGAECEPYIACDDALMQSRAPDVVLGTRILLRATGASRCLIGIEDDMPAAIAALQAAVAAAGDARITVAVVPARYPEGGERQLIQALTGQEVPSGSLPLALGMVVQNVGTAVAVADAVLRGLPLIERVVTVTGAGVTSPRNFIARIGTPLADLISAAGGYTPSAERLIMGGPMMGFALPDDSLPVVKATNCVLVAGRAELARAVEPQACIRCGECATVCPASLLPQQLHWHARSDEFERARGLGLMDCIECGCCDLACPSHIPLTGWFRHAKASVRLADAERQKSDLARERFEARTARLEREQQEREARLKAKQAALAAAQAQRPEPDA